MKPKKELFLGLLLVDVGSDIVISVVHPDAIADQNPYDDLVTAICPKFLNI